MLSVVCVWEKSGSSSQRQLADNYKCASILATNDVMWHLKGAPICLQESLLGPWKAYDEA